MTPLEAVQAGDREAAIAALEAMASDDRRFCAADIYRLHKAWHRYEFVDPPGQRVGYRLQMRYLEGSDEQRSASRACMIVLATAPQFVHDYDLPYLGEPGEVVALASRVAPPWLCEEGLEALAAKGRITWPTIEGLVAAGLCERFSSDRFVELLVEGVGFRSDTPLVELLRQTPGLIEGEMLYRLFEVEGGQQSSLSSADKYRRNENKWSTALAELAVTGELDRARLLDACLEALSRDFPSFRSGWFSRFFELIKPTDEERIERTEPTLRLLGSTIPSTVSFAVKGAAKLVAMDAVAPEALLRAVPPALQARQKGTVKKAATLLLKAAKTAPVQAASAAEVAIDALVHPEADVQAALLDVIETLLPLCPDKEEALRERLAQSADLIAPSLRSRLPGGACAQEADEIGSSAERLDPMDESLRLSVAHTHEEALDAVAHALEHSRDPMAQERALGAIARFADPTEDWKALSGPVRKRARTLWRKEDRDDRDLQLALSWLALAWTDGDELVWVDSPFRKFHGWTLYLGRVEGLRDRVLRGVALPLLSTPTHRSGFVELQALRERVARWQKHGEELDPHDVVLALMRIPAEDAQAALALVGADEDGYYRQAIDSAPVEYVITAKATRLDGYSRYELVATPSTPVEPDGNCLALRSALLRGEAGGTIGRSTWLSTTSPNDPTPLFAIGIQYLDGGSMDNPLGEGLLLEPARDSWVELGITGHWLLLLTLASRGARAIDVALDVLIDGVDQGRVDAEVMGGALGTLMRSGVLKAKRLAKTLEQASATSRRHAAFVTQVIQRGLRGAPDEAPRDVGALLSLLYELLVAQKVGIEDADARTWLEAQTRGGQVKKLRSALLALAGEASGNTGTSS